MTAGPSKTNTSKQPISTRFGIGSAPRFDVDRNAAIQRVALRQHGKDTTPRAPAQGFQVHIDALGSV